MLLAIDIGNTNTVLGVFDGEKLEKSWRIKTDARSTADELALTFRGLLADHVITGTAACSTVPGRIAGTARDAARVLPGRADRDRRARRTHRRQPAVREPEGGRRRPHREHAGRAPPGRQRPASSWTSARRRTSTSSTSTATSWAARWRRASRSRWTRSPPAPRNCARWSSSRRADRSGSPRSRRCSPASSTASPARSTAWCGASRGVLAPDDPARVEVIATGGLASLLIEHCETVSRHEPDLTLVGLRLVYERNT